MMILVLAEHKNQTLQKRTREVITAARGLSRALELPISGLVLGDESGAVAEQMVSWVETVYTVKGGGLEPFRADPWTSAVASVAQEQGAQLVMLSASRLGQSLAPRVAFRLGAPLLEDVTELMYQDGALVAKRLSYLARVTETVRAEQLPTVISVKPNTFGPAEEAVQGSQQQASITLSEQDGRVEILERTPSERQRVALEEADIVVTGGRGVGSAEGFNELVEPLADALGAGIGATRAVVDAGWRPFEEQIGQTGKTVTPNLYLALGVSGAVQHLSGMNRAKVIAAINKDPDAPIFKITDYGVVGDVKQIVPAVLEALKALKD